MTEAVPTTMHEVSPSANPFTPTEPKAAPAKRPSGSARAKARGRSRAPRTTAPATGTKRTNLSEGLSMAWSAAGSAIAFRDRPVGMVMQLQAPSAGKELNSIIQKHPALAMMLSPIFGQTEMLSLSKVILPPLLIGIVERRPELMPALEPILMPMLFDVFRDAMRLAKQQRETFEELTDATDAETREAFEAFTAALFGRDEPPAEVVDAEYAEPDEAVTVAMADLE